MPGGIRYEEDEDEFDEYLEQERQIGNLQAFLRHRLRLAHGPGGDGPQGNGTGNGNHQDPPPFDPDQFADADE